MLLSLICFQCVFNVLVQHNKNHVLFTQIACCPLAQYNQEADQLSYASPIHPQVIHDQSSSVPLQLPICKCAKVAILYSHADCPDWLH